MRKVLVLAYGNIDRPSLRYRIKYTLDTLQKKKCVEYTLVSFYSNRTDSILKTDRQMLKIFSVLADFAVFIINSNFAGAEHP